MKTIHKLVLKSYLGPMFLTFFIVMFVLMMNFIWRYIDELVGKGLDAGVIIELMSYAKLFLSLNHASNFWTVQHLSCDVPIIQQ